MAARPPFGPLTLDLFGDVGLRIRRVSYLYTINALKLHMWLVHYIRLQSWRYNPLLRHSYTVESSCRVYNVVIGHNHRPRGLLYGFDKHGTILSARKSLGILPYT